MHKQLRFFQLYNPRQSYSYPISIRFHIRFRIIFAISRRTDRPVPDSVTSKYQPVNMAHQRTIWMAFSLMIIMTIAITPAQGEANWLETINTSLQDLRKSVAKSLEDLSMKFAFTGGKPSPRDTSKILEASKAFIEI